MSANNLQFGNIVGTSPALLPGSLLLQGRFGRMEKLEAGKHGASLWQAIRGHDDIWDYMKAGPFLKEDEFASHLQKVALEAYPFAYTVVDPKGAAKGVICLMTIRPEMRVIETGGIFFSHSLQRTTLATEAHYLLMRYVFDELNYRRYEWRCNALNEKSRRAAERLGFIFEGIFRQHEIVKGQNRDTAWYSILDSEWPPLKERFERWLEPDNFDAKGRQINSLAEIK